MGKIDAGRLRERVTLLTPSVLPPISDGRGGFRPGGPDTEQTVWARVHPLRADEKLRLGQVVNANSYEITVRRVEGLASGKQRIKWQGQDLNVQAVTQDESREYQLLTCINSGQ